MGETENANQPKSTRRQSAKRRASSKRGSVSRRASAKRGSVARRGSAKRGSKRASKTNSKKQGRYNRHSGPISEEEKCETNYLKFIVQSIENVILPSYPAEVTIMMQFNNELVGSVSTVIKSRSDFDINEEIMFRIPGKTLEDVDELMRIPFIFTAIAKKVSRVQTSSEKSTKDRRSSNQRRQSAKGSTRRQSAKGGGRRQSSKGGSRRQSAKGSIRRQSAKSGSRRQSAKGGDGSRRQSSRKSVARRGSAKDGGKTGMKGTQGKIGSSGIEIKFPLLLGEGNLDILPLIKGEKHQFEVILLESSEKPSPPGRTGSIDQRSAHDLKKKKDDLQNKESLLNMTESSTVLHPPMLLLPRIKVMAVNVDNFNDDVPPLANAVMFTIESIQNCNLPDMDTNSVFRATIPFLYPSEHEDEDVVIKRHEFYAEGLEESNSLVRFKKWSTVGPPLYGPPTLSKYRLGDGLYDIKNCVPNCDLKSVINSSSQRLNWNEMRRTYLSTESEKYFYDAVKKYRVWPIEFKLLPPGSMPITKRMDIKATARATTELKGMNGPKKSLSRKSLAKKSIAKKSIASKVSRKSVARKQSAKKSISRKSLSRKSVTGKSPGKAISKDNLKHGKEDEKDTPTFIVYADISNLLYPGVTSTRVACPLLMFQQPEFNQRWVVLKPRVEKKSLQAEEGKGSKRQNSRKSLAGGGRKKSTAGGGRKSMAGAGRKKSTTGGGRKSVAGGGRKSVAGAGRKKSTTGGGRKSVSGGGRKSVSGGGRKSVSGGGRKSVSGGGRKSVAGARKSTAGGGHKKDNQTSTELSGKHEKEEEPVHEIVPSVPVFTPNGKKIFVIIEVSLLKPFLEKKTIKELDDEINKIIPEKVEKEPSVQNRLKTFNNGIFDLMDIVQDEYKVYVKNNIKEGRRGDYFDESEFWKHLDDSGMLTQVQPMVQELVTDFAVTVVGPVDENITERQLKAYAMTTYTKMIEKVNAIINGLDAHTVFKPNKTYVETPSDDDIRLYVAEACEDLNQRRANVLQKTTVEINEEPTASWWRDSVGIALYVNDRSEAQVGLWQLLNIDRKDKHGLLLYAAQMAMSGNTEQAELYFNSLVENHPRFFLGWVGLHIFYLLLENEEGASINYIKGFEAMVDVENRPEERSEYFLSWTPQYKSADRLYINAAIGFLKYNLPEFASICLMEELEKFENSSFQCHYYLGVTHYLLGNYEESIKHLEKASKLKWEEEAVWSLLGHSYYRLGDEKNAMDAYNFAVNIAKDYSNLGLSYKRMGYFYLKNEEFEKAKDVFKKAAIIQRTPGNWLGLGIAFYSLGEFEDAEIAFAEANKMDPQYPEIWAYLALVNLHKINYERYSQCIFQAKRHGLSDPVMIQKLEDMRRAMLCLNDNQLEGPENIFDSNFIIKTEIPATPANTSDYQMLFTPRKIESGWVEPD